MPEVKPQGWHWLPVLIVVIYAGVLLIAPLGVTLYSALKDGLDPIMQTLADPNVQHALLLTLYVALWAVVLNSVFGVIIAWVLVRQNFRGRRILNALVDFPFVFSPVIAGYVMITLFGRNGWLAPPPFPIVFAVPAIILAKTFVTLPFVAREVAPVLASLDQEQENAAYVMGASRWRTFWRVVFPGIRNGLLYGVVLTLARALGEFGAVTVAGGSLQGQTETATIVIFRMMQDRNTAGAYSVALLLGCVAVIVLMMLQVLRRRVAAEGVQGDYRPRTH